MSIRDQLVATIKSVVVQANYIAKRYRKTIWIVGDGRSGTTWLQELINFDKRYREMFEPFHPILPRMQNFQMFKYIKPGTQDPELMPLASEVFSGKFKHARIDYSNRNLLYEGLLVKDIFTHLLMGWAHQLFPEVKMILLFRHPFSVALSKLKLTKGQWMSEPVDFLSQPDLYNDHLRPYEDLIKTTTGEFEKQILIWAIVHYVPLKQLTPSDVHLVFYEELVSQAESELKRVFAFIEGTETPDLPAGLLSKIKVPSRTSRKDSGIKTGSPMLSAWKNELTEAQISNALEILHAFGLDRIYNQHLTPDRKAAENMLRNT